MAPKRKKSDEPKLPTYCIHCGQALEGEAAARAANPSAAFCCECGTRLTTAGTCRNPGCPYQGMIPQCG